MCGRFTQRLSWRELHELMSLLGPAQNLRPRYNVAPAQTIAAVRAGPEGRTLSMLRWGLIPAWAREPDIGYRLINARAETAHEKPSFRARLPRAALPDPGGRLLRVGEGGQGPGQATLALPDEGRQRLRLRRASGRAGRCAPASRSPAPSPTLRRATR